MTGSTKPVRTIKNWTLQRVGVNHVLHGRVFEDDRFPSGSWIRTSTVVSVDFAKKIAETRNTIYHLN
ncbi:hypothetical protein [Dyella telluris]|uniref:Uncharacterized protein n=1 Tax=Dyella telluris TaxID=2763498 RepID=A0A7G8Q4L0_9GAMM|nr:hypothetical protein [Dyella telluris]QNK01718.1 hypothetical protein H8F01_00615 [Dyella telluris]